MDSRILQIALRIALLREEFSEQEIAEAIKLLQKHSSSSELLAYLSTRQDKAISSSLKKQDRKTKSTNEKRSRAIIELEQKDPEKHEILSEFDNLVRQENLLPRMDDLKRFGEHLEKSFVAPKSRHEAISKIMSLLSKLSVDDIKTIVSRVNKNEATEQESAYQDLANFLIEGKENQ